MMAENSKERESVTVYEYRSPVGVLLLGSFNDRLCLCDWKYRKMRASVDNRIQRFLKTDYSEGNSAVIESTIEQLSEYFNKKREIFNIPLLPLGTEFQQQVWQELMNIPYGKSATYKELALRINNKDAIRAVASANGANALSILIPCHRIIGSMGELVGYAGGLNAKKKLLDLESAIPRQFGLF